MSFLMRGGDLRLEFAAVVAGRFRDPASRRVAADSDDLAETRRRGRAGASLPYFRATAMGSVQHRGAHFRCKRSSQCQSLELACVEQLGYRNTICGTTEIERRMVARVHDILKGHKLRFYVRHIKGHTTLAEPRFYVNRWCDEEARRLMRQAVRQGNRQQAEQKQKKL